MVTMEQIRRKLKRAREQVDVGLGLHITVSSVRQFKLAHALATVFSSASHRSTITLRPGLYPMRIECSTGVDITGPRDAVVSFGGGGGFRLH